MPATNQTLEDLVDDLIEIAESWAADFVQDKADTGALFVTMLNEAKNYYKNGGDRPPIPPRVP